MFGLDAGAMFFGSRRRRSSAVGVPHPSIQRPGRRPNECLAAYGRERPLLYRRYVCALAEEEWAEAARCQTRSARTNGRATHVNANHIPTERSGKCAAGSHTQAPQSS
jgi:hypothetical protein